MDTTGFEWIDGSSLPLESKGFDNTPLPYGRLPADLLPRCSDAIRKMSDHATGHYLFFATDSKRLAVEWVLKERAGRDPYIPPQGMYGVDIYNQVDGAWRFVCNGRLSPDNGLTNLVSAGLFGKSGKLQSVLVYLPTRGVVTGLRLGVDKGARIERAAHASGIVKPIVHYGTSIVHGGCASRPGLCFTSVAGRTVDAPYVNLGFSGQARLEPVMAEAMARIDASLFIVDPVWNCSAALVRERLEPFLRILHAARPDAPILVCEGGEPRGTRHRTNPALKEVYDRLVAEKSSLSARLHYLPATGLLRADGESTHDYCHPNDLGSAQMAGAFTDAIRAILLAPGSKRDAASYVDPFIGTSKKSRGHTFPSAVRPAGLVQPGPDTGWCGWHHCSGYAYEEKAIYGFSQTHLTGTGCAELGDVLLQPFTGAVGADGDCPSGYDHRSERSEPGYYAVTLTNFGVRAEMTAARRVAFHRWTFPKGRRAQVLVDTQWGVNGGGSAVRFKHIQSYSGSVSPDNRRIVGGYTHRAWLPREVHFALEFSRPFASCRQLPAKEPTEKAPRYVLDFDLPEGEQLLARIAISTTDDAGALGNLAAEGTTWDFDRVRASCRADWNRLLGRIEFPGASDEMKTKLYTALYHAYILPNDLADADGRYRGANGKIARAADGRYFTGLSLWDTFRAVHPFYTFYSPELVMPVVESMMANYRATGYLPVIPYFGRESFCMIGNHSIPVIVDAYLKGFGPNYDWKGAFAAIDASLSQTHRGKRKEDWNLYDGLGYYPFDKIGWESISRTLECGYDDWCAARMAEKLGSPRQAFYDKRARYYRNVFDRESGFFRGKDSNGQWMQPFDPGQLGNGVYKNPYTEGNAWQYLWHVLQDPDDLMRLLGGKNAFAAKLDTFFTESPDREALRHHLDVTGLIGMYAHGNEPSHHVAYLYQYAGRPRQTARRIREICDLYYKTGPDGLCGNDDCGQMSVWYVFACLGFYPVNPCGGEYVIGAPQVPRVDIRVCGAGESCKTLTILARNLSKENKCVKSVTLNGKPVTDWRIRQADILRGGELVFEMEK